MIMLFSVQLGWSAGLGLQGARSKTCARTSIDDHACLRARHAIAAVLMRHTRSALLQVLSAPIRAHRSSKA